MWMSWAALLGAMRVEVQTGRTAAPRVLGRVRSGPWPHRLGRRSQKDWCRGRDLNPRSAQPPSLLRRAPYLTRRPRLNLKSVDLRIWVGCHLGECTTTLAVNSGGFGPHPIVPTPSRGDDTTRLPCSPPGPPRIMVRRSVKTCVRIIPNPRRPGTWRWVAPEAPDCPQVTLPARRPPPRYPAAWHWRALSPGRAGRPGRPSRASPSP